MNARKRGVVDRDLILSSQVALAMDVIGDRWAFMIIRDIFLGIHHFEGFRRRNRIARGTLASRLKSLVANGVLYRHRYQLTPARYEYRLTDKGLDLYPVVLLSWDWETKWGRSNDVPDELTHARCGKTMRPVMRCGHCDMDVAARDVSFSRRRLSKTSENVLPRHQRRSKSKKESSRSADEGPYALLDIVGDRWTSLVVAAAFFGLRRFDDIAAGIGIATNILADRLRLLQHAGVLDRVPYQDNPVRYEYRLSRKGRDLYPRTIAAHAWAEKWLLEAGRGAVALRHVPCGKFLRTRVVCDQCSEILDAREVTFDRESMQRQAI